MNIGEAASASGVSAKMIRYYEQTGLIPSAGRTASGYRTYTGTDVQMLRFIRRARDLGFSMKEITDLLALWLAPDRASADVKQIALAHVADLERRIAEMTAMKQALAQLAACCHGDQQPDCPILDGLAG